MTDVQDDEVRQLLREIRDVQREQLAEYRRVTERSLELQQRAVGRQERLGQLYRHMVLAGGILVVLLLFLLVYLLVRWSSPLFLTPRALAWGRRARADRGGWGGGVSQPAFCRRAAAGVRAGHRRDTSRCFCRDRYRPLRRLRQRP